MDKHKESILKLCAYNVHGLYNKINFPYFFEFLASYDVFCCLETHVYEENRKTQLKKYLPDFNLHWKPAERIANRGRGISETLIGWKNDLHKRMRLNVSVAKEEGSLVVILKKASEIIRVLPVYLRGENWSSEFTNLENYMLNFGRHNLVLIGDMNVRIGELQQTFIPEVHANPKVLSIRKSHDKTINRRGRDYFEMCEDYNLRILNGAFEGDENGDFTYSSTVGDSVNDVAAVSSTIIDRIKHFSVVNATWSDHFPLAISLDYGKVNEERRTMKLLPKLMWGPI